MQGRTIDRVIIGDAVAAARIDDVVAERPVDASIDATGVEMFMQLRERLASANVALHISGIKLPVENVLRRAGALNDSPLLHMYRTDVDALQAFGRLSA